MEYFKKIKEFLISLKNNKFFLIFLLLLVFIYLINNDFFLQKFSKNISLKYNKIIKLKNKIKNMQRKYSSINIERINLLNTEKSINKLKLRLKQNKDYLPDDFKISDLVKQISENMPKTNFEIKSIKFSKTIESKKLNYRIMPISISIISEYNQALLFLKKMNSLKRIILIQNMQISADKKIPSYLDINLISETFALKRKEKDIK
ncbi:MAG: type 4a pilus biogenesis protein PilO [bacterium]